jgi:hypothetical protein
MLDMVIKILSLNWKSASTGGARKVSVDELELFLMWELFLALNLGGRLVNAQANQCQVACRSSIQRSKERHLRLQLS